MGVKVAVPLASGAHHPTTHYGWPCFLGGLLSDLSDRTASWKVLAAVELPPFARL